MPSRFWRARQSEPFTRSYFSHIVIIFCFIRTANLRKGEDTGSARVECRLASARVKRGRETFRLLSELTCIGNTTRAYNVIRFYYEEAMESLEFRNLPLIEVAIQISFQKPAELSVSRIMELRARLEERFSVAGDLTRYDVPPGGGAVFSFDPTALSGVQFSGHENGVLLSVQPQLLTVRWLKRFREQVKPYPRFPVMLETLEWSLDHVLNVLAEAEIQPAIANVRYLNFVRTNELRPTDILNRYFVSDVWTDLLTKAEAIQDFNVAWKETSDLEVRLHIQRTQSIQRSQAQDEQVTIPGFLLTTVAGRKYGSADDTPSLLRLLHSRLQSFFEEIISDKAKDEWEFQGRMKIDG